MSAAVIAIDTAVRPGVYRTKRFEAFHVSAPNRTYVVRLKEQPANLQEAVSAALLTVLFVAKDRLVIKETDDERETVTLHIYAIKKQSRPTRVYRDYAYHNVHQHYADPVCAIDGKQLGVPLHGVTEAEVPY